MFGWGSGMLTYHGKARPTGDVPSHPAAYHCLDVAACAAVLLDQLHILRSRLIALLGTSDAPAIVTAMIALHDVGKLSRSFQAVLPPELWQPHLGPRPEGALARHDDLGFAMWRERLAAIVPGGPNMAPIARAVFGHHRAPVPEQSYRLRADVGPHGLVAADTFTREIVALLIPTSATVPESADLVRASWLVAGLAMIADWLGSSQRAFPYERPEHDLESYWQAVAMPRARHAVDGSGVVPAPISGPMQYAELMAVSSWDATPMQRWAETVDLAPALYVIEDSTGAGKTEAALMLAHRLMSAGLVAGFYVALPTMATSDGMFSRLAAVYRRMFDPAARPSLALAHGARQLHSAFQRSILDPASDSYCAEWIADESRLTFLANVGVGTVDQAILSVLPSHCQCVRMMGLSQRVLILDEVHAYDAYMGQEIVRLIEAQAAFGAPTILLSATLPADTKRRLLAPYGGRAVTLSASYPLATVQVIGSSEIVETPVAPRRETVRDVPLSFAAKPDAGFARAIEAARSGQAVLYIRNTIRDAIGAFQVVPNDVASSLFHSRFAMCDRQSIQADALARFGKTSTSAERLGRLLIATQVVEQSLDLDFDLIVSDLAPVDLIIQRAGRLWRHERERPAGAVREMVVVGPEPTPGAGSDWLSSSLPLTADVYQDLARLWLSADALRRSGGISAPHGLRDLIEHVYGPEADARAPEQLKRAALDAEGKRGVERGMAHMGTLRLSDGYCLTGPWLSDERVPTRLGDNGPTVRLAAVRDGDVIPWAATRTNESDVDRLWALSECRTPSSWAIAEHVPADFARSADAARASWREWQRETRPLLIVGPDGSIRPGFHYSQTLGLRRIK